MPLVITLVITSFCWLIFSGFIHIVCKLIGTKRSYQNTASVSLQVLSVAYVLGNFTGAVASRVCLYFNPSSDAFVSIVAYLFVEFAVLVVYWPRSLASLHGFRTVQGVVVGIVAAILFLFLNLLLFSYPAMKLSDGSWPDRDSIFGGKGS